jgi:hypothetical protein
VSELDSGIANAWNKGITLATGNIVGILNSDDYYDLNSLENIYTCINYNTLQLYYGICKRLNTENKIIEIINGYFKERRIYLTFSFSHTTCFVPIILYKIIGIFNEKYQIAFDIDFLVRAYKYGVKFNKCKILLICMKEV